MKISDVRFGDKLYWGEGRVLHALSDPIYSDTDVIIGCRVEHKCSEDTKLWLQGALVIPIEEKDVETIHYKLS